MSDLMKVQELFELGMKRELADLKWPRPPVLSRREALMLDLGAGNNPVPGAQVLDYPQWDARERKIPYSDESVDGIFAFHFFEHCDGETAIALLRECERVLRPGGLLTTCIPHRLSALAFQDLDHKSFWTEETWKTLLRNPHYEKHRERPWRLEVRFNCIMGIVERNLALFTQLERV